jgi:hypothetical protein
MSDALGILLAAAAATASPPEPARHDVSIALPALDGLRGIAASYEQFLPERRLSFAATAQLRESAAGDFLGVHTGVGGELRWYWRARHRAWLSRQPAGSMVGWFTGGRIDMGLASTRDRVAERWIGHSIELGATALVGYRIAPWRDLEITPTLGLGTRREFAMGAPDWNRGTLSIGLAVGWLY